jgi:hypothetical protein
LFVHYGWGDRSQVAAPSYRTMTTVWTSGADSGVIQVFGRFPGSERFVMVSDGLIRGSGPLPFGRESQIAIGTDRVYVGPGDRYEILVFSVTGATLPAIRKPGITPLPLTTVDVNAARDMAIAEAPSNRRSAIESRYAAYPYPRFLPAYAALLIDAGDNLWVQDHPRPTLPGVRWTVFSPQGEQLAEITLPRALTVFEIGADYILGRYLDPDEAIPQVRVYRLDRPRL